MGEFLVHAAGEGHLLERGGGGGGGKGRGGAVEDGRVLLGEVSVL